MCVFDSIRKPCDGSYLRVHVHIMFATLTHLHVFQQVAMISCSWRTHICTLWWWAQSPESSWMLGSSWGFSWGQASWGTQGWSPDQRCSPARYRSVWCGSWPRGWPEAPGSNQCSLCWAGKRDLSFDSVTARRLLLHRWAPYLVFTERGYGRTARAPLLVCSDTKHEWNKNVGNQDLKLHVIWFMPLMATSFVVIIIIII